MKTSLIPSSWQENSFISLSSYTHWTDRRTEVNPVQCLWTKKWEKEGDKIPHSWETTNPLQMTERHSGAKKKDEFSQRTPSKSHSRQPQEEERWEWDRWANDQGGDKPTLVSSRLQPCAEAESGRQQGLSGRKGRQPHNHRVTDRATGQFTQSRIYGNQVTSKT